MFGSLQVRYISYILQFLEGSPPFFFTLKAFSNCSHFIVMSNFLEEIQRWDVSHSVLRTKPCFLLLLT